MDSGGVQTEDSGGGCVSPLVSLDGALTELLESGLVPVSAQTAAPAVAESRAFGPALVCGRDRVDGPDRRRGMHRGDGHANVKVLARHAAKLSNGEALDRLKTLRMLRESPKIKAALWAGDDWDRTGAVVGTGVRQPADQRRVRDARKSGSLTKPSWITGCSRSGSGSGNA